MKTIRITCEAAGVLPLEKLSPLQGDLKTLPEENYAKLRASILKHGITFPFFVWKSGKAKAEKFYIIDAHQRDKALQRMAREGYTIPPVPVAWIEAANQAQALEKILLCNSRYGEMTESTLGIFLTESLLKIEDLAPETAGLPFPIIDLSAPVLQPLTIQAPPKMAWALIGIPIQHFAKVQSLLDQLPAEAKVSTTANDQNGNED